MILGPSEIIAGLACVALAIVRRLSNVIAEHTSYEKLKCILKSEFVDSIT